MHFFSGLIRKIVRGFPQPAKLDLNKKSLSKQKTIQNFTIEAQRFRKIKNEYPPKRKWELPANQCLPICQPWADWQALVSW